MSFDRRPQTGAQPGHGGAPAAPAAPGKRTLTDVPTQPDRERGDKWTTLFRGAPSRPVDTLARVSAPAGLHVREAPGSDRYHHTIPFNELVQIERTTTESTPAQRWAYVVAPSYGAAGFVEERFLMWDPPEPSAELYRVRPDETLMGIVGRNYPGRIGHGHDARLYCQAVYLANRHVAGVTLTPVALSDVETFSRGEDEEETLRIFKGVQVIEGQSIWLPSNDFVLALQRSGEATSGQTTVTKVWDAASGAVDDVVDDAKFLAGVVLGVIDGAFLAVRDLVQGAVQMFEALLRAITADIAGLVRMAKTWLAQFKTLWDHRRQITGDFFARWNARDSFDRGKFRGEVMGWLLTNVAIIILTAGEASPGVLGAIATRFPQAVADLRLISDLGEVTTYTSALGRGLELPENAQRYLDKRIPSGVGVAKQATDHARIRNEWDDAPKIRSIASTRSPDPDTRLYEFKVASPNELEALADVLHDTEGWVLRDTVKLTPHGLQALKLATRSATFPALGPVFSGESGTARAAVDHDTVVLHPRPTPPHG